MDKAKAQEIARGYMAPRSHGINQFAQLHKVTDSLIDEIDAEIDLASKEGSEQLNKGSLDRWAELMEMLAELNALKEYVNALIRFHETGLGGPANFYEQLLDEQG